LGLVKKTAIADVLSANLISRVFASPEMYSGMENLTATLFYGLYLFNDFSGYSDMATGLAGLLGYRLAANFNEPFKSSSVSEFWRRWHISLSQWFGDYVFKPLSFALKGMGSAGVAAAAIFTFALSGLWHGPAWTFVFWGLAHGLAIAVETLLVRRRRKWNKNSIYRALSRPATLIFLIMTYPLFAAPSLESAGVVYAKMFADQDWATALKWWETYGAAALPAAGAAVLMHFLPAKLKNRLWHWAETLPFVYLKF
jgi:D-alanyl-lipoteichoic acid acyltransferase DltB (MBOAT superfamily)